jgi:predicted aldo/keto reductase-like oxidoreductase
MEKIRLGKTNMMVSRIGFGGIPIKRPTEDDAVAVVRRCLDLGMNFIDTANAYGVSEERIGKGIQGRRKSVFLATKTHARTREEIESHLQLSLRRFGTDYIDLYQFHGVRDLNELDMILDRTRGLITLFEEIKRAGVIKHIGVTTHQIDVAKAAVKSGQFETIMFPFNFIAHEPGIELMPLAREHDVGFIVMKPLAGGRLQNAAIAFKYLFQFPDVLLIPGIEMIPQVEEIVQLLEGSHEMTDAERQEMQRTREELGTRFCRRCDYCQPCTQEIPISMVMDFPTLARREPPEWLLSGMIAETMEKAGTCIECGDCEPRCPYNLPIMEIIAENFKAYQEIKRKYQK